MTRNPIPPVAPTADGGHHPQRAGAGEGETDQHDAQTAAPHDITSDGHALPATEQNNVEQERARKRELHLYVWGLCLALLLTAVPFALVAWGGWPRGTVLIVVAATGLLQMVCHFRFFLHINLAKQKREDLQLILFSALLLAIMVGGTIWIMADLAMRMHGTSV